MDRHEIEHSYKIENGIIRSPGKFEGCALYAPYFHDAYLNGMEDGADDDYVWFAVSAEDRAQFPEIGHDVATVLLREDDNGFVHLHLE